MVTSFRQGEYMHRMPFVLGTRRRTNKNQTHRTGKKKENGSKGKDTKVQRKKVGCNMQQSLTSLCVCLMSADDALRRSC